MRPSMTILNLSSTSDVRNTTAGLQNQTPPRNAPAAGWGRAFHAVPGLENGDALAVAASAPSLPGRRRPDGAAVRTFSIAIAVGAVTALSEA